MSVTGKLRVQVTPERGSALRGAHASRVLVRASRLHELCLLSDTWEHSWRKGRLLPKTKFVLAERQNQHARRVRSPETAAFTLIEILTASIAAALILVAIYGLFQRAVKMRDHATERAHEAQLRARAERIIRNDLRNAFVSGTDTRLLAIMMEGGKQNTRSHFPGDLRFTTTTGKDTATDGYGDVQEVEYSIANAAGGAGQNSGTLTRFITRDLLSTIQTTPAQEPLLSRVSLFEVAFYDGQSWQDSWQFSTDNPTLPQAIRVQIQQEPSSDQLPAEPLLEIMEPLTVTAQTFDNTASSGTATSGTTPSSPSSPSSPSTPSSTSTTPKSPASR